MSVCVASAGAFGKCINRIGCNVLIYIHDIHTHKMLIYSNKTTDIVSKWLHTFSNEWGHARFNLD